MAARNGFRQIAVVALASYWLDTKRDRNLDRLLSISQLAADRRYNRPPVYTLKGFTPKRIYKLNQERREEFDNRQSRFCRRRNDRAGCAEPSRFNDSPFGSGQRSRLVRAVSSGLDRQGVLECGIEKVGPARPPGDVTM